MADIFGLKYRFTLLFKRGNTVFDKYTMGVDDEPVDNHEASVDFVRDDNYFVIGSSITGVSTFVKRAKQFFLKLFLLKAESDKLTIYVENKNNNTFEYERYYEGKIDTDTTVIDRDTISADVDIDSIWTTIKANLTKKIELPMTSRFDYFGAYLDKTIKGVLAQSWSITDSEQTDNYKVVPNIDNKSELVYVKGGTSKSLRISIEIPYLECFMENMARSIDGAPCLYLCCYNDTYNSSPLRNEKPDGVNSNIIFYWRLEPSSIEKGARPDGSAYQYRTIYNNFKRDIDLSSISSNPSIKNCYFYISWCTYEGRGLFTTQIKSVRYNTGAVPNTFVFNNNTSSSESPATPCNELFNLFERCVYSLFPDKAININYDIAMKRHKVQVLTTGEPFLPYNKEKLNNVNNFTITTTIKDLLKTIDNIYCIAIYEDIENNTITLCDRHKQFSMGSNGELSDYSEMQISFDKTHYFGSFKTGSDKGLTDDESGRLECMMIQEWNIDNNSESQYDITMPYYTSVYGITEYIDKCYGRKDPDSKRYSSQNDDKIMMFGCSHNNDPSKCTFSLSYPVDATSDLINRRYFNLQFSPVRCLLAHLNYIAISGISTGLALPDSYFPNSETIIRRTKIQGISTLPDDTWSRFSFEKAAVEEFLKQHVLYDSWALFLPLKANFVSYKEKDTGKYIGGLDKYKSFDIRTDILTYNKEQLSPLEENIPKYSCYANKFSVNLQESKEREYEMIMANNQRSTLFSFYNQEYGVAEFGAWLDYIENDLYGEAEFGAWLDYIENDLYGEAEFGAWLDYIENDL
jgi:hypothetical protein